MDWPIKQIGVGEEIYPKPLTHITDPPSVLYCRGNLELLNSECFAVVGTRKLTSYGKEVARKITTDLAQTGLIIVSGLAMGIDAVAHQTTLDTGGRTIAVLGSGLGDVKSELSGVARVNVYGGTKRQMEVVVDPAKMKGTLLKTWYEHYGWG